MKLKNHRELNHFIYKNHHVTKFICKNQTYLLGLIHVAPKLGLSLTSLLVGQT